MLQTIRSDHPPAGVPFNVTDVRAETRLLKKGHCKVCQAKAVETLVIESSCNTIITLVIESSCDTIITLGIESSCNTIIVRKQYIELHLTSCTQQPFTPVTFCYRCYGVKTF